MNKRVDKEISELEGEEGPILKDLRKAGLAVTSLFELTPSAPNSNRALPILLHWLPIVRNHTIRMGIVRALSARWARPTAAKPLIEAFERQDDSPSCHVRWQIGDALSVVADDTVFEDVVRLSRAGQYRRAREMLMLALANMRNPQAVEVLIELLDDEEVAGHAVMALGKLRAQAARPYIEPFLAHSKAWVRREARKALAKIDKARQAG